MRFPRALFASELAALPTSRFSSFIDFIRFLLPRLTVAFMVALFALGFRFSPAQQFTQQHLQSLRGRADALELVVMSKALRDAVLRSRYQAISFSVRRHIQP